MAIPNHFSNNCMYDDLKYPVPEYRLVNGKCFYLEKAYLNFEKARENCKQKGWKLFEPIDFVELREVSKFPGYNDFMWIGITDIASEGNYVYDSNGKSITLKPRWLRDKPYHLFGTPGRTCCNCIATTNSINTYMYDLPCVDTYIASLCEL